MVLRIQILREALDCKGWTVCLLGFFILNLKVFYSSYEDVTTPSAIL